MFKKYFFVIITSAGLLLSTHCSRSPNSHSNEPTSQLQNVFGNDDRVAIDHPTGPLSAIGRLDSGCTGTLLSPRLVLTAGHCMVDNKTGRLKSNVTFFRPAFSGINQESKYWIQEYWLGSYAPEDNRTLDFAVLKLAEPAFGFATMEVSPSPLSNVFPIKVSLAGYSTDKDHGNVMTHQVACSLVSKDDSGRLLHDCDASSGISGAPLFLYNQRTQKNEIVALSVSEFRRGAQDSVYRDRFTAEFANVGIPTSNFAYTVSQMLSLGENLSRNTMISGAFYMQNTNPRPSAGPSPRESPPSRPPQTATPCPGQNIVIDAQVLTGQTKLLEDSACAVANRGPAFVQMTVGTRHQTLYDFGSQLGTAGVYLCSILNSFRNGQIDYVQASYQIAPQLCAVLASSSGISQYVSGNFAELSSIDPLISQKINGLAHDSENLGRLILRSP